MSVATPPVLVASKANIRNSFKARFPNIDVDDIGNNDDLLKVLEEIKRTKDSKLQDRSVYYDKIIGKIIEKYNQFTSHEVEIQIGLKQMFMVVNFEKTKGTHDITTTLKAIPQICALCTRYLSDKTTSLYLDIAAATLLTSIATKNNKTKRLLIARFNLIGNLEQLFIRLKKNMNDYDQGTCLKFAKKILELMTQVLWNFDSKDNLVAVKESLCGLIVELVDPRSVFTNTLNSFYSDQTLTRVAMENIRMGVKLCAEDVRHLALNLLGQLIGRQLSADTYVEFCKKTKCEVLHNHICAKDDRESEHFHMVSVMAVSIISHDVKRQHMYIYEDGSPLISKTMQAGLEVATELLDHSISAREAQRRQHAKRKANVVRKGNRTAEIKKAKEKLAEIEANKTFDEQFYKSATDAPSKDNEEFSNPRRNSIHYERSKWSLVRNSVRSHGAVCFLLKEADANKMLLAYCASTLWGWAKYLPLQAKRLPPLRKDTNQTIVGILNELVTQEILTLLLDDLLFIGNETPLEELQISACGCIATLAYAISGLGQRIFQCDEEIHEIIRTLYSNSYFVRAAGASAISALLSSIKVSSPLIRDVLGHDIIRGLLNAAFVLSSAEMKKIVQGRSASPLEKWVLRMPGHHKAPSATLGLYAASCLCQLSSESTEFCVGLKTDDYERLLCMLSAMNVNENKHERDFRYQYMSVVFMRIGMCPKNSTSVGEFGRLGIISVLLNILSKEQTRSASSVTETTLQYLLGTLFVFVSVKDFKQTAVNAHGLEILTNIMLRKEGHSLTAELGMRCLKNICCFSMGICKTFIHGMDFNACPPSVNDNGFQLLLQMASSYHSPQTRIDALSVIIKGSEFPEGRELLEKLTGEETIIRCCVRLCEESKTADPEGLLRSYGCRVLARIALESNKNKEAIYENGGMEAMMEIALYHYDVDGLQADALRGIHNLCFVPWIQHIVVKDFIYKLIKLGWTSPDTDITSIISSLFSLCSTNVKNRDLMYRAELYVKAMDCKTNKVSNKFPGPSKMHKIPTYSDIYSLKKIKGDFSFDRDLRKPEESLEVNLATGKSGKAKYNFMDWLHKEDLNISDNKMIQSSFFLTESHRNLVTRGLRSSHTKIRGRLWQTIANSKQQSTNDPKATKVPLPPASLSQQMRRSMKEMWIRMPATAVKIPGNNTFTNKRINSPQSDQKRWNRRVETIRAMTPEYLDRDEYGSESSTKETLNVSLKVAISPALSPRNNFKFEKKTDIFAPVDEVMKDIEMKVKAKVHTSHSPIKSRKLHLIPRVDGSKIYSQLGKEHVLPDGKKVLLYEGTCYTEMIGTPVDDPEEANKLTLLRLMKQPLPKSYGPIEHRVDVIRPYSLTDPPRPTEFPNKSELMTRKDRDKKNRGFHI
jgi:hypothetical protein